MVKEARNSDEQLIVDAINRYEGRRGSREAALVLTKLQEALLWAQSIELENM